MLSFFVLAFSQLVISSPSCGVSLHGTAAAPHGTAVVTPLVTWLTLPQPGPALVPQPRAEDGGNEMVTREYAVVFRTVVSRTVVHGTAAAPQVEHYRVEKLFSPTRWLANIGRRQGGSLKRCTPQIVFKFILI